MIVSHATAGGADVNHSCYLPTSFTTSKLHSVHYLGGEFVLVVIFLLIGDAPQSLSSFYFSDER